MSKKGENTRALFLSVSGDLFLKNGYEKVSVAEICRAAGKAKGLFFYYFDQKETVLKLLAKNEIQLISQKLEHYLAHIPGSSLDKMSFVMHVSVSREARVPNFMGFFGQTTMPEFFEKYSHELRDDHLLPIIKKIVFEGVMLGEFAEISEKEVELIYMGISTFMHRNFERMMMNDDYYQQSVAAISSILEKSLGVSSGTINIL